MYSIFEIPDWETLRIAGIGRTRTGKTTFFASNAISPVYAIDADKGYVRTRKAMIDRYPEVGGDIYFPSNRGCLVPLHIHQEAEENIFAKDVKTTVIDSVTKIYGYNTRPAVMAGRMTPQQREQAGFSKNKASNLQNKADAIQVLTYLAGYGTHIFYIWHEQETVDMESVKAGKMDIIMRETMSKEERKRLFTSVDIVLRFSIQQGRYAIYVDPETRGYGTKPNTGFWVYDPPGNYWRGALARIYGLIYTTFDSKDQAIAWGKEKLGVEDPVEIEAFYDEVKAQAAVESHSDMWVAWMTAVEEKVLAKQKNGQETVSVSKNEKGESKPEPKPEKPPAPKPEKKPETTPVPPPPEEDKELEKALMEEHAHGLGVPEEDVEGILQGELAQDELTPGQVDEQQTLAEDIGETLEEDPGKIVDEALGRLYGNKKEVSIGDYADFSEYRKRFGKEPYDTGILHRAKKLNEDWPSK